MNSIWTARRSATDRKVSGVAGGIARAWDVDPVLVRVGFAVLALSGGIGLVLYIAGWLMMPQEGKQSSYLDEAIPQTRGWSREVRIGLVVLACLIGVAALSWLVPFSFSAAVVMAAVWYFGYYRNRPHRPDHSEAPSATGQPQRLEFARFTGAPTPFTQAATAWQQRIAEYERMQATRPATGSWSASAWPGGTWTAPVAPVPTPDLDRAAFLAHPDPVGLYSDPAPDDSAIRRAQEQRALRRRSARRVGLASLVVLGLTMTGLGVASSLGVAVPTSTYFAAALLVVGLTMLAGSRFGRPRGTVLAAILLTGAMAFSLVNERVPAIAGEIGTPRHVYTSAAAMPPSDHLDLGSLTVDLRDLDSLSTSRTYTASVDTGQLVVLLPRDVPTTVKYEVDQGVLKAPGLRKYRSDQPRSGTLLTASASAAAVLTLDLRVDRGQLEVRR